MDKTSLLFEPLWLMFLKIKNGKMIQNLTPKVASINETKQVKS
jgi:hypothetical protein